MARSAKEIKKEAEERGLNITSRKDLLYLAILFAIEDLNPMA